MGRLAANATISNWRRAYNQRTVLIDEWADATGAPADSAETVVMDTFSRELAHELLEERLAQITPERVEALKATYLEGETREEYSRRTGTPINTIASRTSRAKIQLREQPELRTALDLLNEAS